MVKWLPAGTTRAFAHLRRTFTFERIMGWRDSPEMAPGSGDAAGSGREATDREPPTADPAGDDPDVDAPAERLDPEAARRRRDGERAAAVARLIRAQTLDDRTRGESRDPDDPTDRAG